MLLAIKNEPFVEVGGAPKICETHVNIIPKYPFFGGGILAHLLRMISWNQNTMLGHRNHYMTIWLDGYGNFEKLVNS